MTEPTLSQVEPETKGYANTVVIGLGGTGIQVASRLRSAIRDVGSRATHIDHVSFAGIDAVSQNSQWPPLPASMGLAENEFLNITHRGFNPSDVVLAGIQTGRWLSEWFDQTYEVPNMPITDAMARSRMMGRLAYEFASIEVDAFIEDALRRAREAADAGRGRVTNTGSLRVFIVASCVGGTGSSGFLPVLRAVHSAATKANVAADVWPVIFLPGAFSEARRSSSHPGELGQAHASNAYAFFRELDHLTSVDNSFAEFVTPPHAPAAPRSAKQLVRCIMLVDGQLANGNAIDQLTTLEMTAAGLYELIMTDVGAPHIGIKGTNTLNTALTEIDQWGKRTHYGSLGLSRIVFPRSTYKTFLSARTRAYLVDRAILGSNRDLESRAQSSGVQRGIETRVMRGVDNLEESVGQLESVAGLRRTVNSIPRTLSDDPSGGAAAAARQIIESLRQKTPDAESELRSRMSERVRSAVTDMSADIEVLVRESQVPLRVVEVAVEKALTVLSNRYRELDMEEAKWQKRRQTALATDTTGAGSVASALQAIEAAESAGILRRLVGDGRDQAYAEFAAACTAYVEAIVHAGVAEARVTLMEAALEHLRGLDDAMARANGELERLVDGLDRLWADDTMKGKDAGPHMTTTYIPEDVTTDVETSAFARQLWDKVSRALADSGKWTPSAEGLLPGLLGVYTEWWATRAPDPETHGVFGLGSDDVSVQRRSHQRLMSVLDAIVDQIDSDLDLWPADIYEAAEQIVNNDGVDEKTRLATGLANLVTLSQNVALGLNQARVQVRDRTAMPEPIKVFAAVPDVFQRTMNLPDSADQVTSDDPDQIIALTLSFGFPIHAVAGVDFWAAEFQRTQRERAAIQGRASSPPPPHVDRRFDLMLDYLTPKGDEQQIAETIVQASILGRLVGRDDTAPFLDGRGLPDSAPLRVTRHRSGYGAIEEYHVDQVVINPSGQGSVTRTRVFTPGIWALFDGLMGELDVMAGIRAYYNRILDLAFDNPDLLAMLEKAAGAEEVFRADKLAKGTQSTGLAGDTERARLLLLSTIAKRLRDGVVSLGDALTDAAPAS